MGNILQQYYFDKDYLDESIKVSKYYIARDFDMTDPKQVKLANFQLIAHFPNNTQYVKTQLFSPNDQTD